MKTFLEVHTKVVKYACLKCCVSLGNWEIIPVSFSHISFQMINWIYLIKCSKFKWSGGPGSIPKIVSIVFY